MTAAGRLTAVVLAAGRSQRMGVANKLLLPWRGKTVVEAVLDAVCAVPFGEVVVVTGHEAERLAVVVARYPVRLVPNAAYGAGLASSLVAGVAAAPATEGYLFALADMPLVTAGTLHALCDAFAAQARPSIVYPTFDGRRGNPVVFDRAFRAELLALTGDRGAHPLFAPHAAALVAVPVADAGVLYDADTPEAYAAGDPGSPVGRAGAG